MSENIDARLTGLETAVGALAQTVDRYITHMDKQLSVVSERINQPQDWRGTLMIMLTLVAMFGTLIAFVISPIENSTEQNRMDLKMHSEINHPYYIIQDQLQKQMILREQREHSQSNHIAALQARLNSLEEYVALIDTQGSRKWNKQP